MLTRPFERPKKQVPLEAEDELPEKLIDIEVTDIDIQYPDNVFIGLTLYPSDSFKYTITGGQTVLRVNKGDSEAHYNLNLAFYHAFRIRVIKVPEPKFIPPSAQPPSDVVDTVANLS